MDWKLLLLSIALPVVLTGGGIWIVRLRHLSTEFGEAIVATGLLLIKASEALADNKLTDEERRDIIAHTRTVAAEYRDAIAAAVALVRRQ